MREILFRGKRIDNNGWVEGLLTIMWGQYHIINPSDENTAYPIEPETVCQYIGLTDKNGSKIFEGDIVKIPDDEDENYTIVWDKGTARFAILLTGCVICDFDNYCGYEIEIISNIFDNPELLREEH